MEDDTIPGSIEEIENKEGLEKFIRKESGNAECKDDLVLTANWFIDTGRTTEDDAVRTSQIEERLGNAWDHNKYTILNDHLVEMDVLEILEPDGPETFILDEMTGEFLMGDNVDLAAHVDDYISRFIDHMHEAEEELTAVADGGKDEDEEPMTLRGVAAEALEVESEVVEDEMTDGETIERMQCLDDVVGAVKSSDEVEKRDDYDQIGFRRSANRYKLNAELAHLAGA